MKPLPEPNKPKQIYSTTETDLSQRYLKALLEVIPQPHYLIGGWSVYLIVNDAFQKQKGRPYIGSRDIDLGFHFDPSWDKNGFDGSPFGKTMAKIQQMGFEIQGPHFVRRFSVADGHALTAAEEHRLQSYEIFPLYIDLLVDSADPRRIELATFPVAEELLLTRVFGRDGYQTTKLGGLDVRIPSPHLQMEMKIKSFPERTTDDKRTKDLTDLCALILYSGEKPPTNEEGPDHATRTAFSRKLAELREEEWNDVSNALDEPVSRAKRIANLIR